MVFYRWFWNPPSSTLRLLIVRMCLSACIFSPFGESGPDEAGQRLLVQADLFGVVYPLLGCIEM